MAIQPISPSPWSNQPQASKLLWEAQAGPQTHLVSCPVFEVFYGGARGGGKTEGSLGDWLQHQHEYGELAVGAFFRRNRSDLADVVERAKRLYLPLGATYNENKSFFRFPNGALLYFEYLDRDEDAQKYQGRNYTRIYIEEATQFPDPRPLWKLKATLRSAAGVKVGMRLTGNPGGPGHNWVKARYITPNPTGYEIITEEETLEIDGKAITVSLDRVFIPSKVWDNRKLIESDPTYILRLRQVGSEQLVKAWLTGDWDIVEGCFFDEFSPTRHVLPADEWLPQIPRHALRFRSFDWGSAKPFSVGWYVVSDGNWGLPRGALLKYREWYGAKGPNIGIKLDNSLIAEGIREQEMLEPIAYGVADPSIFNRQGGPSIAEQMALKGVMWRRADNNRVVGWAQLHSRLVGSMGLPMLYFLDTCQDTIRTLPSLQHDETHPEDVDTEGEDHAGDETRYACMARPYVPQARDLQPLALPGQVTFNQALGLIRKHKKELNHG